MEPLTVRGITRSDLPAVTRLAAAAEEVDRTGEHYDEGDFVEVFDNEMIDPSRDWLVVERRGELVAHSALTPRAVVDGVTRVDVDGTVHPAHRRQGIGTRLFPTLVDRAHGYAAERGARAVVTALAPSDNAGFGALAERAGLRPDRWQFLMLTALTDLPSPPAVPAGHALSSWEDLDPEEIRVAHNTAFADHPGFTPWSPEMWEQWVTSARNNRPALGLVLRDPDGRIAAYLQTMEFDAATATSGIREAYVGKLGTLPQHRRRGLAGLLLRTALSRYRDAGFERAALDVDSENPTGALGVYLRAGFVVDRRWTIFSS